MIKRPKLPCENRFLRECDQPKVSFNKFTAFSNSHSMLQFGVKVLLLRRCVFLLFGLQNLSSRFVCHYHSFASDSKAILRVIKHIFNIHFIFRWLVICRILESTAVVRIRQLCFWNVQKRETYFTRTFWQLLKENHIKKNLTNHLFEMRDMWYLF
mgnify:CR=1 FL=1